MNQMAVDRCNSPSEFEGLITGFFCSWCRSQEKQFWVKSLDYVRLTLEVPEKAIQESLDRWLRDARPLSEQGVQKKVNASGW